MLCASEMRLPKPTPSRDPGFADAQDENVPALGRLHTHGYVVIDSLVGADHSCPLLKITSEITSLLEVLRGASNFGVILRNYLEAPKAGNQLLINLFLFKNHKNVQSFSFFVVG